MGNRGYGLHRACPDEKAVHSQCESAHLDAFRKGEARIEDNPCRDEWEDYKRCVQAVWDSKTKEYLDRKNAAQHADIPHTHSADAPSPSTADGQQLPHPAPLSPQPPPSASSSSEDSP